MFQATVSKLMRGQARTFLLWSLSLGTQALVSLWRHRYRASELQRKLLSVTLAGAVLVAQDATAFSIEIFTNSSNDADKKTIADCTTSLAECATDAKKKWDLDPKENRIAISEKTSESSFLVTGVFVQEIVAGRFVRLSTSNFAAQNKEVPETLLYVFAVHSSAFDPFSKDKSLLYHRLQAVCADVAMPGVIDACFVAQSGEARSSDSSGAGLSSITATIRDKPAPVNLKPLPDKTRPSKDVASIGIEFWLALGDGDIVTLTNSRFSVSRVPEPSALALLGLGLAGLGTMRRRKSFGPAFVRSKYESLRRAGPPGSSST